MEWMDLESHPELATLQKAEGIQFRSTPPGHFIDWHPAPRRQFVITLSGEVEIGLGDGTKWAGDLLFGTGDGTKWAGDLPSRPGDVSR